MKNVRNFPMGTSFTRAGCKKRQLFRVPICASMRVGYLRRQILRYDARMGTTDAFWPTIMFAGG